MSNEQERTQEKVDTAFDVVEMIVDIAQGAGTGIAEAASCAGDVACSVAEVGGAIIGALFDGL